jgi:hypothetical protein
MMQVNVVMVMKFSTNSRWSTSWGLRLNLVRMLECD